ncbi:MAG: hemolysin family protein [Thermoanaerobaculia bacterium]|nr:hemolysin family protein [Thermoanaerobaculia bacterium]
MTNSILVEVLIIVAMIVANGVFAMSEIAVVSARKARLLHRAKSGNKRAEAALRLAERPERFLSTIQIGITTIGVLAGAFGGATLARELATILDTYPLVSEWSAAIAVGLVVVAISFLSIVLGELVPKRIALGAPETIASAVAPAMETLSRLASPLVTLLSLSGSVLLAILRIKPADEMPITEDELRLLLHQGAKAGTIEAGERQIVERVFVLGGRPVRSVMTPRTDIEWLDLDRPIADLRATAQKSSHGLFPVATRSIEKIAGIVGAKDLWAESVSDGASLRLLARTPLYVPEKLPVLRVLDMFRETRNHVAIVVDEYGAVEGLVTPRDLFEALVGELPTGDQETEPWVVERSDGSYSLDAGLDIEEVKLLLGIDTLEGEKDSYQTIAGYVIERLRRLPKIGESVESNGWRFEIIDMDGRRVDRIIVSRITPAARN